MSVEYRIGWAASSNITFKGETDWQEWGGDPDDDADAVERELEGGPIECEGLSEALEASGFEWWVETREPRP
jgi:hypothetical protein